MNPTGYHMTFRNSEISIIFKFIIAKFILYAAFHEALANAATLSVYNMPHLYRLGLYNNKSVKPYLY